MVQPVKITRVAWTALALVALANIMSLLDRNILAILAPRIQEDLNIGSAEMGMLYGTVFALFYALFSLPVGRLCDGWIRSKILGASIAVWSLATAFGAFANGFAMLAISRLGVGIGEAATQPAGISLLYDYFPKARRGMVMAVVAAAIAIGLGGSLLLGGVAADWWDTQYAENPPLGFKGWQFAFLVAALPGFVLAIFLWRMAEPARGEMDGVPTPHDPHPFRASGQMLAAVLPGTNWLALWQRKAGLRQWLINLIGLVVIIVAMWGLTRWTSALSPRPALSIGGALINPHVLQWAVVGFGLFAILNWLQSLRLTDAPAFAVISKSPALMLTMLVGALQSILNYGVMGFTPSFIINNYAMSPAETGLKFGLIATALGIVGPLISGPVSDFMHRKMPCTGRVYVTLFALLFSPMVAPWVYSAPDSDSFFWRFVLYSLILTMWLPPLYAAMFDLVLPRMRGMTISLYLISYTIVGLGVGPYAVGMLADRYGGDFGMAIKTINLVVAPAIVVLLVILALRIRHDDARILTRAQAAGEPL